MYAGDYPVVHLVGVDSEPAGHDPKLEHFALSATGYASFLDNLDNRNIDYKVVKVPGSSNVTTVSRTRSLSAIIGLETMFQSASVDE